MKKELLSIIIPVYNAEAYLENCLKSILNQSYENVEIICVDDGSIDNSFNILTRYSKADSRIKIVAKQNGGVSSARNAGIEKAKGDYITFVDSDDEIECIMYETLIRLLKKYKADISHCSYKKIDADGTVRIIGGTENEILQQSEEAIQCLLSGKYFTGSPCNKIYSKTAIGNIRFNEKYKINEDVLFNFEVFRQSTKIVFIDQALYRYYERDFSACSTTSNIKKSLDCADVSEIIFKKCSSTTLEEVASYRHYIMLINKYRCYLFSEIEDKDNLLKDLKKQLNIVECKLERIPFKQRINVKMMLKAPYIYKFIYNIYNRLRKPNWDIN